MREGSSGRKLICSQSLITDPRSSRWVRLGKKALELEPFECDDDGYDGRVTARCMLVSTAAGASGKRAARYRSCGSPRRMLIRGSSMHRSVMRVVMFGKSGSQSSWVRASTGVAPKWQSIWRARWPCRSKAGMFGARRRL